MRRAIVIGSNGPSDPHQLKYAEKDACRVVKSLASPVCDFRVENSIGETADLARTKFLHASAACSEGDTFVAYFVGHGIINQGDLFLLFSNSDNDVLMLTSLWGQEVLTALGRCKASNRLLVLDCCNAGQITSKSGIRSGSSARVLMKDLGFVSDLFEMILASDALEFARELDSIGGGFLSLNFVDALSSRRSEADKGGDGAISVQDMEDWLKERAIAFNKTQDSHDDRVPIPRRVGVGHGTTFLSRPAGQWPYHEVVLPDGIPGVVLPIFPFQETHGYLIGKCPVTNEALKQSHEGWPGPKATRFNGKQWEQWTFDVFGDPEFGDPKKPAVGMTLRDACNHCQWIAERSRGLVSIVAPPTLEIWETALFGNIRPRRRQEWLQAQPEAHSKATYTVSCENADRRANRFGIIDLIGNVWEWCVTEDDWRWFTYGTGPLLKKPWVPRFAYVVDVQDAYRPVPCWLRGGGFYDDLEEIDLTIKLHKMPGGEDPQHADVGFRWSATVPLSQLPAEIQEALQRAEPLPPRRPTSVRGPRSI